MKKTLAIAVVIVLLFAGMTVRADEVLKLKEKIIDLQNKGKLGIQNFTLCSKIMGYGSYVALNKPVVDRNGSLLVYYEPVNICTNVQDGIYEIWYTQDIALLKENNDVIMEQKDLLNFHYMTKKPVLDLFAQNSLDIKGQLPAGKYKFKAVLKDQLRGKSITKIIDFELK